MKPTDTPTPAQQIDAARQYADLSLNRLADLALIPRTTLRRKLDGDGWEFTLAEMDRIRDALRDADPSNGKAA